MAICSKNASGKGKVNFWLSNCFTHINLPHNIITAAIPPLQGVGFWSYAFSKDYGKENSAYVPSIWQGRKQQDKAQVFPVWWPTVIKDTLIKANY